jgi:hypothetical protein
MDTIVIVLIVVIILLVYFLYAASASKTSSKTLYNLNKSNTSIANADLTNPKSYRFSYESWIYVNNWNNTSEKYIYNANAGTEGTQVIKLYLDKTAPTLYCKLSGLGNTANPVIKVTENFPIQKWVYVVISVDSQIADCYLDGKLIKSTKLPYLVDVSSAYNINFGICDAYVTGFKRNAFAMNPQTAWANYMAGNGFSGNKYGMNLTITKDNATVSQISY